jgi:hypothetical protein
MTQHDSMRGSDSTQASMNLDSRCAPTAGHLFFTDQFL